VEKAEAEQSSPLASVTDEKWILWAEDVSSSSPSTRVNTERLAARETLLYRLGSEFNRTFSCGNPLSVAQKT
jgi:hypothetical protein